MADEEHINPQVETIIRLGLRDIVGNHDEVAAAINAVLDNEEVDTNARYVATSAREYLQAATRAAQTGPYDTVGVTEGGHLTRFTSPDTEFTVFRGACDTYYQSVGLDYHESAERLLRYRHGM